MLAFDTYATINRLKATGMPEAQAEAVVNTIGSVRELDLQNLTTKDDLTKVETALRSDLAKVETELKSDIKDIRTEMRELELRLDSRFKDVQLKIGAMIFALGGVMIAIKFFAH